MNLPRKAPKMYTFLKNEATICLAQNMLKKMCYIFESAADLLPLNFVAENLQGK
jgi:hypothetical protein